MYVIRPVPPGSGGPALTSSGQLHLWWASSAFGRKDHPPRRFAPPLLGGDSAIRAEYREIALDSHPAEGGTACGGVGAL